jgi:REP element-mobilizing transposase RayT
MCRGNGGQAVFHDTGDHHAFLKRLGCQALELQVEVHAYALMRTHVHLFVRTRAPNLARFMQGLLTWYTQWYHARHGTYGHLFQGRYKALLVENAAYGSAVSRYIHLNCVRTASGSKETVAQRQARLRDYAWSSYPAMIGLTAPPAWLVTQETLSHWGTQLRAQQTAYAQFVEEGLLEEIADPRDEARAQSILGHDRFVDRIKRLLQARATTDRESAATRRHLLAADLTTVLARVARVYKVAPETLRTPSKGHSGNEARQVALWLAWEHCRATLTVREIGEAMGGVCGTAVGLAHRRVAQRLVRDKRLKRRLQRLL